MKNYFETFLLPVQFAIDLDALEQKYFALQKQFHPDSAGVAEIENSILVNEAYAVLQNPLRRAAHILQLNGIDVEKDSLAPKPDMATLEEVLEIQEKIPTLNAEEIANLRKELNLKMKFLLSKIELSLENKDFKLCSQFLISAKYFDKILIAIRSLKLNNV
jgi:molecular chaperone HscB